jgi:hypothetical protein
MSKIKQEHVMRRKFIALATALAFGASSLGGCATNPATGQTGIDPVALANLEVQIQQYTKAVCSFVPTLGTVAGVVATYVGQGAVVDIVAQVANSICQAVTAVPAAAPAATVIRGQRMMVRKLLVTPTVNGVPIQGYFVK